MTKPDSDPQISSLYDLIGVPKPEPKAHVPDVHELFLWSEVSHAKAPSILGPVKMPDVHLSQQIAWFHRLMNQAHARQERGNISRVLTHARRNKIPVADTPERREYLKQRQAAYMRNYRELRRLDRLRMRGDVLTKEDMQRLEEHRRRAILLKKGKMRKRRQEIKRAYLDALRRDRKRGDLLNPGKHTFIIDTIVEAPPEKS